MLRLQWIFFKNLEDFEMKYLCTVFVVGLTVLCACGKKSSSVGDPGPSFDVQMQMMNMSSNSPRVIKMFRDDPTKGDELIIQPKSLTGLVSTQKILNCSSNTVILGGTKNAPDATLFNIHLVDAEFPGLAKLPLESICTLKVILENNIGSTWTRDFPIAFEFDKQQIIKSRHLVAVLGTQANNVIPYFPLDYFELENPTAYPLKFIYKPNIKGVGRILYHYSKGLAYSAKSNEYEINEITVSAGATELSGNFKNEVRFTLPPGASTSVYGYYRPPPYLVACQDYGMFTFLTETIPPESAFQTLQISRSFDFTDKDMREPLYFTPTFQTGSYLSNEFKGVGYGPGAFVTPPCF
jgi:hypothetical protein